MNKTYKGFASDNNSGVHPDVLEMLTVVNAGHVKGYGDDNYTKQATELFKEHFGNDIDVYFVFNGTGANVLAISALTNSFHSVLCPATAHIAVDECGAPEKISGCKLIPVETNNGKLTPQLIKPYLHGFDFEHHSQPKMISISQVTEMGTVYSAHEIQQLANLAHSYNMYLHVDGARIANAAVALDMPFVDFTRNVGVDVLSFGGTKNGMLMGEAVVFFNKELSVYAKYFRKQNGQLFSKMRYTAAQFIAYFSNNLWKKNAKHANNMAQILANKLHELGVEITQAVNANGVFVLFDKHVAEKLNETYFFYPWNENRGEYRLMTSFDTSEKEINNFIELLKKLLNE